MSEKRFTMKGSTILENGEEMTAWDCCDLLNELNKDNEELGISIKLFEDDIATKDKKIGEQQDTIDKLQELVAELGATLLMNGFEIEINGKDLNELIKDE